MATKNDNILLKIFLYYLFVAGFYESISFMSVNDSSLLHTNSERFNQIHNLLYKGNNMNTFAVCLNEICTKLTIKSVKLN